MVYYSVSAPSADEPSCIDLSLEVGQPAPETAVGLRKNPSYALLNPNQRAYYLHWLANGRTGALDNIGFALLFFFGLERRSLVEQKDRAPIVEEVFRLLEIYPSFGLFNAYLNLFLAFSLATLGSQPENDRLYNHAIEKTPAKWDESLLPLLKWDEALLAVVLAWLYKRHMPLPTFWAIRVARKDPLFSTIAAATVQPDELSSLFELRYREQFDRGLILEASSDDHEVRYRPVSPSLLLSSTSSKLSIGPTKIADVLGSKSQFYPLVSILASCVDDLRYSTRASVRKSEAGSGTEPPTANSRSSPVSHAPQTSFPQPKTTFQTSFQPPTPADSRQRSGPGRAASEPSIQRPTRAPAMSDAAFRVERIDQTRSRSVVAPPGDPPPLRWYGPGDRISAKSYLLRDPMVYCCEGAPSDDEASCIDLRLEVGKPAWESAGALGYYTSYRKLSPTQRANYLTWLANNRTTALSEIGYAFLFFYGLERRLIVERQDLSPIVKECVRLLESYTFSASFDGYVSRFLAFVLARDGIATLKEKWFEAVFEISRLRNNEDFLAVALAWFFQKSAPLPVSWAIRIASKDPRSPQSIVVFRIPDQFHSLFEKRYREEFGEGLALKVAKREHSLDYRPASPSLVASAALPGGRPEPIMLPNVLGLQSQFSRLVAIWSSCIDELRPVSRILAKGVEVDSREAFDAMPDDLKAIVEHPEKKKWAAMVAEHTREDGFALVEVSKLAALHGLEPRAKLTPTQSRSIATTAEYMGLAIEPDSRITTRTYGWEDVVSLIRAEAGAGLPTDPRYLAASLMLELGVFIAAADGSVDDVEIDQVARFLESQFLLGPTDTRRLEALKRVFMERPPTLAGLGKRLQFALSREQREAVGQFLTGVAAANGIIDRKEISALRSAYRALDIGVDQLNKLVDGFRRSSREPVEVVRGEPSASSGEAIPLRAAPGHPHGLALDEGVLRRLMAETEKVAAMLGDAMREESLAETSELLPITPLVDSRFGSLEARFHPMLANLLERPLWPRAEFDSLARACGVMPSGALDAVNEWAYDLFDDPIIIEQEETLLVQSHLVEARS